VKLIPLKEAISNVKVSAFIVKDTYEEILMLQHAYYFYSKKDR
jgi:hypothetical protein